MKYATFDFKIKDATFCGEKGVGVKYYTSYSSQKVLWYG